jgi:hypothetical protein
MDEWEYQFQTYRMCASNMFDKRRTAVCSLDFVCMYVSYLACTRLCREDLPRAELRSMLSCGLAERKEANRIDSGS